MIGYSGTPLVKKLGIKAHHKIYLQNAPANYRLLLGELPEAVVFLDSLEEKADVVHVFVKSAAAMEAALFELQDKIAANGSIWVSWYKKASKIPTDVTEMRFAHRLSRSVWSMSRFARLTKFGRRSSS